MQSTPASAKIGQSRAYKTDRPIITAHIPVTYQTTSYTTFITSGEDPQSFPNTSLKQRRVEDVIPNERAPWCLKYDTSIREAKAVSTQFTDDSRIGLSRYVGERDGARTKSTKSGVVGSLSVPSVFSPCKGASPVLLPVSDYRMKIPPPNRCAHHSPEARTRETGT